MSAEKAKELTVAGAGIWNSIWNAVSVSGTKGVDLSAYNSVVDYRIRFECENEDGSSDVYDQAGSLDPRFGVKSCELRAGAFSSRSVRLIVERSNGQRIWQVRMKMSPTTGKTVSTDDAIADSRSGTSVSIPLEDGTLRLNAAFFSTGWSKIGAAGNRNQGALYLTYDKSHWMKDMPNAFKKMPLVKWTLPGSHDAGMYTHDGGADNLAMTQTEDLEGQLNLGMRYFDLRPGYKYAREWIGLDAPLFMVHGPVGGGSFRDAVHDTLKFLTTTDSEIVVFHISGDGMGGNWKPASESRIQQVITEERVKLGIQDTIVRYKGGLDRSPDELRTAGTRLIVVYGGTMSSWNEADYVDPEKVSPNVVNIAQRCTTELDASWVGISIQLQATPPSSALKMPGGLISNAIQGNKLVLDRRFYPWLAEGNVVGCRAGPTYVINDYVDNALTDVVARGMRWSRPATDPSPDAPVSSLPAARDWKRGDLHWMGPDFTMTKFNKLVRQRDGNVILFQLGRAADGSICKESVVWTTGTDRQGARLDFQDNGDFAVRDLKNEVRWKQGPAERLSLQADGNLVLYGTNGKAVWASNTPGKGTNLPCN